eukprot:comp11674_c0_seq2/m.6202 comp11674_c0_seq2/g.6202  ORF comp11674_c0_seq2/g.6202 comp11674_c0_seq2/m.6202 type:complete len:335 (-) comp11674_c0_seq2:533-1537(-)
MAQNGTVDNSGRNLMVNFIPTEMSEAELKDLFSKFGVVESARIIQNKQTMQSAGYGFVVMATDEAAEQAIQGLNGWSIRNKRLKVGLAQPDAATKTNVYVAGFPANYTENELKELFGKYGEISEIKILRDEQGNSRGAGFVRFAKRSAATSSIEGLHNYVIMGHGKPLTVRFANPKERTNAGARPGGQMDVFGAGMSPYNMMLRGGNANMFAQGMAMANNGQWATGVNGPMGAMPGFANNGMAAGMGRFPGAAATPAQPTDGLTLFVYNLPPQYDNNALGNMFLPFGQVATASVKAGKGYGFVTMATQQQALAAVNALNGYPLHGRPLQVSFKR